MYHIFSSEFSRVLLIQFQKNNWHHMNMHVHIYDIASISTILPFLLDLEYITLYFRLMCLHGLV